MVQSKDPQVFNAQEARRRMIEVPRAEWEALKQKMEALEK